MQTEAEETANRNCWVDGMMGGGSLRAMMGPRTPVIAETVVCMAFFLTDFF